MLYFLASLVLGYFLLKELWMRSRYDIHKIPCPPKLPILGYALSFRKGNKTHALNLWIQEWREKLGFPKLMKVCIPGRSLIFVTDISLVRNCVLAKSYGNPRSRQMARHAQRFIMGDDPTPYTFATQETTPYVKAIRRSYAASFTSAGMKQALHRQLEVMHQGKLYLEERLDRKTIDLQDFFTRLMLDVAGKVEMDLDLGGLDKSSPSCDLLITCGHHLRSLAIIPFFELRTKMFPNSDLAQKINQDFKALHEQYARIAAEVDNRGEPDEEDSTLAANFKRVCIPGTNDPLPMNLLRGELAFAIVAGLDTISHQLSWIFALLSTHPLVVEKLLDELKTHGLYGGKARELEFEDLSELRYFTAVIKEGMRMIHAQMFVSERTANRDMVLDGYRVPKGTSLYIPSNLSMNCEMEWEDHLAFKPERWLEDNFNVKEKYYVPFSLGERDCAGTKLAKQFMKVVIVYFITRFSFELVGDSIESLVQNGVAGIAFEAKDGVNTKITPRVMT